jgi:hypothetical protein
VSRGTLAVALDAQVELIKAIRAVRARYPAHTPESVILAAQQRSPKCRALQRAADEAWANAHRAAEAS